MQRVRRPRPPHPPGTTRPAVAAAVLLGLLLAAPARAGDEMAETEARAFCTANADGAADIRRELQIRRLILAERRIESRIADLEEATRRTRQWLAERADLLARADDQVVAIYARMRPDAAAAQIASLHPDVAVSILMKLPARAVGPIMAEMETPRAAALAAAVSRLHRTGDAPSEGRS